MSKTKDIADYYNQTLNHYQQHWKLNSSKALHYGLWYKKTKRLTEALENTNKKVAELSNLSDGHEVLDAGCGIGGTAMYLASNYNCDVKGITLSEKQLIAGQKHIQANHFQGSVELQLMNYEQTDFDDSSFDSVYGIESICHSQDKRAFIEEAFRILKPNGKLIVIDFFQQNDQLSLEDRSIMNNWLSRWAVDKLSTVDEFIEHAKDSGFKTISQEDLSQLIIPSALRLYRAALLGSIPSRLYSIYYRNVSRYAKDHYKSGIYQYKALKKELWNYSALVFEKPCQKI